VKIGSIRKMSLSLRFVAASRKTRSTLAQWLMTNNAEVKLCNLYHFAEAFNGIAKYFAHLSCSTIVQ